ncbi:MAG: DUF2304 domain-containing protein [Dokdonella sp.]|jgi:hypothetical protein|uniref:DUF2304 domain-containing protein n=1 Tax=Dokdonella sp. TaxID=2291710 RepID=UPI001B5DF3E0|nr:DUF2304 domain-containing protein [Dokdonella sp.]MBK8124831.1 DUF2304 domain-containing protein [Dokdonella sp.]MBP6329051.1 DUF2304 domain-containing protein [Dokdonella sp.]
MLDAQITAAILGVCLAGAIFYLVRRDHLHGPYAAWWLMVAAATLILGIFPAVVTWLGLLTGIKYAPVLPIIVALSLILLRLLKLDIDRSRQERQIRRLTQKLAILDHELQSLRAGEAKPAQAQSTPETWED